MTVLEDIVAVYQEDMETDADMELLEETIVDDNNFLSKESKNHLKTKGWVIDSTVPFGWSYKGEGSAALIKAPNGKLYPSRRLAFADMLNSGKYCAKDVIMMKRTLIHEGWKSDERIPRGWMFRKRKASGGYKFLGQGGELFKSTTEALKFVEKYRKYFSEADVDKIKRFNSHSYNPRSTLKTVNINKEKNLDSWSLNDEGIPEGWRIKRFKIGNNEGSRFLSPEGRMFQGRRAALKYMIDEKYPEEKIDEMRSYLKYDGWLTDPKLPAKWFFKKKDRSGSVYFVSANGEYLQSKESLRINKNNFTQEEIQKIEHFTAPFTFDETQWRFDDSSVPKGWGINEVSFGNDRKTVHLLSPERKKIQGKMNALKYMVKENYPKDQIKEMRKCLRRDGWLKDPNLPKNWFYRKSKHHIRFLSPDGQYFRSRKLAKTCFPELNL